MKIMWIAAAPMGKLAEKFGMNVLGSGGWIDACLEQLNELCLEIEIHYFALSDKNQDIKDDKNNVHYYMTNIKKVRGSNCNIESVRRWKEYINKINPDIIQVWGTEYSVGLDIEKAANGIPVLFYIQGVMNSLKMYRNGELSSISVIRVCGLWSIPKLFFRYKENLAIKKQAEFESEMIRGAAGIIIDSEWACAQYKDLNTKTYYVPLPINKIFSKYTWDAREINACSGFTVAGRTPLKGIHNVIEAWAKVVQKYPDAKLYIPGNISSKNPKFLYEPIYLTYLRKIINKYSLQNNIVFLGKISQEEMALYMKKCNVFIMPSCIENHSSTLREAMTVGAPCVSAFVGSVGEFVQQNENGYMYRYDDINSLAYYIDKVLSSDSRASLISQNAAQSIKAKYLQEKIGSDLYNVYRNVISENQ